MASKSMAQCTCCLRHHLQIYLVLVLTRSNAWLAMDFHPWSILSKFSIRFSTIAAFLNTTPLKDRKDILVKHLFQFFTIELNQRKPHLQQQQQEIMQVKSV